tara:strand:- start:26 stop:226 length:201 start_codon:yes stop_codon:yes gene_type:complete
MEILPIELKNIIEEKAYKMNYEECIKEMKEKNEKIRKWLEHLQKISNNNERRNCVVYIEEGDGLYL